jgi:hypothetical protein
MLRRIWRVNRNGTSRAKDRENIDENCNVTAELQLCNTVVLVLLCYKVGTFILIFLALATVRH